MIQVSGWDCDPFAERELPPLSARLFTTLIVARLRAAGAEILAQDELELRVRVRGRGDAETVRLCRHYERYRAAPATLETSLQQALDDIARGEMTGAYPAAFEKIAPRLFPLLLSSAEWQAKHGVGLRIAVRPLLEDLGSALVLDAPDAITYVELDAFARWGVDRGTAEATAMANLERRAGEVGFSQSGEGERTLLIDRAADGYAATRALLPARLEEWARRVPGELLLGLPHRNFLIGFSSQHPSRAALCGQVARDAGASEHALSARLLLYRGSGLEILG